MNSIKNKYLFVALTGVMVLTIVLSFIMNIQFIQEQLKTNLIQEIEYNRSLYKEKIVYLLSDNNRPLSSLFEGDQRSNGIQVLLYDNYGKNIGGNIDKSDQGISNVMTMMLNGLVETVYDEGVFYSFTNIQTETEDVYLMLEMSDQKYIEGIRNYYFRTFLIIVLVSISILLVGYKLTDLKKTEILAQDTGGVNERRQNRNEPKSSNN